MTSRFKGAIDALDLVEATRELTDKDQIMNQFGRFIGLFGFEHFLITGLPSPTQRLEPYVLLNGWSAGWSRHYHEQDHYPHDPAAKQSAETVHPFIWSEITPDRLEPPRARLIMNEAREFGLIRGFSVPIYSSFGPASVTMAGRHAEMSPRERQAVYLVSMYMHGIASRATHHEKATGKGSILTLREREIMHWVIEGKSLSVIGDILNLSEGTVYNHMLNIRKKLGVTTTAQAITEVLRLCEFIL